ncbi:hypothetical protein [Zavarzinella formosa]|uniref:hypothetical protein n=1 Tax=Zavarzinella formosa TaxID=360055 RepID=UPI0002F98157|nr:hypothetical protein [Zavarzinella formosa]
MNTTGTGAVLPQGSPIDTLPEGGYEVTIDGLDDSGLLRCVYPNGFVKHHQVNTVEELAVRVTNQLRARYGANEIVFAHAPASLDAGQSFVVEG